jgi:predicted transcriptional regulator
VVKIRYAGLLVSVFGLSIATAFAQDDAQRMAKVICAGDPECEALAAHRLTADNLRKMFAVDRELITLMKESPDLERRMDKLARSIDPQRRLGKVTLSAQVHEKIPEIAEVFRRHKISGRDYMFTHAVAMVTAMTDVTLGQGTPSPELMTPALKFWRSMDPALKAEADAWKKMRGYDQGINR